MSVTAVALHYYNSCFYMSVTAVVYISTTTVLLHEYDSCFLVL